MALPPVYTVPLLVGTVTPYGVLEATVPDGYAWIVVDIEVIAQGGLPWVNQGGWTLSEAINSTLIARSPWHPGQLPWHDGEVRQQLPPGDTLIFASAGFDGSCRVTGYQLSLP